MKKYTFFFGGYITVEAEDEEAALDRAEDLVSPTAWQESQCTEISINDIRLSEVEDE